MDSDGDLFTVEERVLWSCAPGNDLWERAAHVASHMIVCCNKMNLFTNVFLLLCKMYLKILIIM